MDGALILGAFVAMKDSEGGAEGMSNDPMEAFTDCRTDATNEEKSDMSVDAVLDWGKIF
jgi:hypothetical protein